MEVIVFGAGSLGSLLGGLLSRVHHVTLVGRDPHMTRVDRNGLSITGLVEEHVHPDATTAVDGLTGDVALLTVKSYDTAAAADALGTAEIDAVCSLQNGLGNEVTLADRLSCAILGGSATYGADLEAPGQVRMTGAGRVIIGSVRGGGDHVDALVDAFDSAGIDAEATDDISRTLWHKAAINAAINPVTALARCRNGAVAESPLAEIAARAADETVAVAAENDIQLDTDAIQSSVFEVAEATAANRSSMLQDILAGKRTEIGAINGAIVDRADGVPVPVNATLTSLIGGLEQGARLD